MAQDTQKNFHELFHKVQDISDHRSKYFNKAIILTKELLPKVIEIMNMLDYKSIYVTTSKPIVSGHEGYFFSDETNLNYTLKITSEGEFIECKEELDKYSEFDTSWDMDDLQDVTFTRVGILQFVETLFSRIEELAEQRERDNQRVSGMIEKIQSFMNN